MSAAARGAAGWLCASGIIGKRLRERREAMERLRDGVFHEPAETQPKRVPVITYKRRKVIT